MYYCVIYGHIHSLWSKVDRPICSPQCSEYKIHSICWRLNSDKEKNTLTLRQKKRQNHQFNVILVATLAHQSIHITCITSSMWPCSLTLWKEISMLWHGRFRQWRVRLHARVLSPFNLPFTLNQIPPGRNCTSGCKKKFDRLVVLLIAVSSRLRNEY